MTEGSTDPQSRLSAAQKAALKKRIDDAGRPVSSSGRIPRRPDPDGPIPLSSTQQRLWFLDQLVPGNFSYNISRTLRIEGVISPQILSSAFNAVVARHESLRTRIEIRNRVPVQIVAAPEPVEMPVVSLENLPANEREARALDLALEAAERPFDLQRGPLFRAMLLRISPTHHILHVTAHHIVTDGWSMEILFQEVSSSYEAGSTNALDPFLTLPLQYGDFCIWQRKWLESDAARRQIAHWSEKLRDAAPVSLPTDLPRPPMPTFGGVCRTMLVPKSVMTRLTSVGREEGATLFMVLLAAFEVFLKRHCGQDDVSVATPIAGRTSRDLEPLIGFFANTLVLRGDLSGDPTFREVLRRVRETALDAFAHQEVPFEQLVETLRPERHLSQNPLAQVLFVLQNAPTGALNLGSANVSPIELTTRTARFDLELHARETSDGMSCMLIASADLFVEDSVARLLDRLECLFSSIVADPDLPVSRLTILPTREQDLLLREWNSTNSDFGRPRSIAELFEDQVARTPDAIAVWDQRARLTYSELNARANQLAQQLREANVGRDTLVGVCLERTPDLVAALLGIWKARGAYVPLDPSYPRERLEYMFEDSGARVLIAQDEFSGIADESCLRISPGWPQADPSRPEMPRTVGDPSDLAYVLYTSGSTGRPKGVALEHGNAFAFIRWAQTVYGGDELGAVLASTSVCFDLSVFELFVPLCSGGSVVLAKDALELPELVHRDRVTLVNTVPSAIAELVRLDALPASVKTVNLAGEPLSNDLAARVYASSGVAKVYNLYGPTEATTYSTFTQVPRMDEGRMTIGRPISNTQIYILDAFFQPTPIGVEGELFIGGAGVARGYLHRPEMTADKFVPDPFRSGGRLYRTGDLARYRATGEIEYLGRRDGQVKIRGFRIETGEIESQIRRFAGVREAAVTAHAHAETGARLVAYLVRQHGVEVAVPELKASLKRQLPDAMIPSAFVFLETLPLTPNGKVDRRRLPEPGSDRPDLAASYTPPRNEAEKTLVSIWTRLLGVERVGVFDNFFDLGGHSLLATQLISRMRDQFSVELPLRLLFESPTVAELAAEVSRHRPHANEGPITRRERVASPLGQPEATDR